MALLHHDSTSPILVCVLIRSFDTTAKTRKSGHVLGFFSSLLEAERGLIALAAQKGRYSRRYKLKAFPIC